MKIFHILDTNGTKHYAIQQDDGGYVKASGSIEEGWTPTTESVQPESFLSPVDPPVIFGIGLNYSCYAKSLGKEDPTFPLVFLKQGNATQHPEKPIQIPRFLASNKVDYEAELAVVIGKPCKNATLENALDFVAGYTCANDVSARDWQFEFGSGQFSRSKTFDTFCPLGPCLVTTDFIDDVQNLSIKSFVNGELRQESNTRQMIFSVAALIVFLSGSTTLLPGTVILTGTPGGTGSNQNPPRFLKPEDQVEIEIESIGKLKNPVEFEGI